MGADGGLMGAPRNLRLLVTPRGETHHFASLTEADVRSIRAGVKSGKSQVQVAREHRTSKQQVNAIVNRKTWAHVKDV